MKNWALLSLITGLVAGCASEPSLADGRESAMANSPLAAITTEQAEKIAGQLTIKTGKSALVVAIQDAKPVIADFLKVKSCMVNWEPALLARFGAPGVAYFGSPPIASTSYHGSSTCMSVLRVHGWEMPAKNALVFEAVFVSDVSGESVKERHEIAKSASGEWFFLK